MHCGHLEVKNKQGECLKNKQTKKSIVIASMQKRMMKIMEKCTFVTQFSPLSHMFTCICSGITWTLLIWISFLIVTTMDHTYTCNVQSSSSGHVTEWQCRTAIASLLSLHTRKCLHKTLHGRISRDYCHEKKIKCKNNFKNHIVMLKAFMRFLVIGLRYILSLGRVWLPVTIPQHFFAQAFKLRTLCIRFAF